MRIVGVIPFIKLQNDTWFRTLAVIFVSDFCSEKIIMDVYLQVHENNLGQHAGSTPFSLISEGREAIDIANLTSFECDYKPRSPM